MEACTPLDINAISTKLGLPLAESRKICSAMGILPKQPHPSPNKRKKAQ